MSSQNDERIEIRTIAEQKRGLSGMAARERTKLASDADRNAFFNALDNPPDPTDRLRSAAERYRELIGNNVGF